MSARRALTAVLLAAGGLTSLGGVASAACEPFPVISTFCGGSIPPVPHIDTDIQCTYDPDSGGIECD